MILELRSEAKKKTLEDEVWCIVKEEECEVIKNPFPASRL